SAEYISRASLELVLEQVSGARDPLDTRYGHYVLLELASAEADTDLRAILERILETALETDEIQDGVIAESGQQRDALWGLRENIPEAEQHDGGSVKHDISVRVSQISTFMREAAAALSALAPHRLSVFGHIGDGNLHYNVLPPTGSSLQAFKDDAAASLSAAVYELVNRLGGSFSAEHGVGIEKRDELEQFTAPVALDLMRTLKKAMDPKGIMNPGKVLS
ncbi:MAG: FAD-linked oxidase C-terminal domain-containing protein, partial [Gammaproteobacteria bacterium]